MLRNVVLLVISLLVTSSYGTNIQFGDVDISNPVQGQEYTIPVVTDTTLITLNVKIVVAGDAELVSVTGRDESTSYGWETAFSADGPVANNQAVITLGCFSGSNVGTVANAVVRYTGPAGFSVSMLADDSAGGSFDLEGEIEAGVINDYILVGEIEDEPGDDDVPAWTLLCESAGRYAEYGSVEYDSEVGQGDVVTVVAMPDEGYRVQKWQGVDGREPSNEQEVTIKRDNQRVRVYFEPMPETRVTKAVFKAGKSRGLDSFTLSGVIGLSYDDIEEGASLSVEILNDEDEVLFSEELASDAQGMRVNWPVGFSYMNKNMADGHLNMVKYSLKNGSLTLGAVKQDLSGWYSPLTLRVSLGDYEVEAVMYDGDDEEGADVINGRGYMPGVFMAGLTDAVTVDSYSDKGKVDRESEMELYSGYVKGRVVTAGDAGAVTGFTVMTGGYSSEVLPLTKARRGNKYTYKRAKGENGPDSPISSATFDFDSCTYMVRYTNGDFGDIADREFEIEFSWDE